MTYTITFKDTIDAETEEQAYDKLLEYLKKCVDNGDVTAFNFDKMEVIK